MLKKLIDRPIAVVMILIAAIVLGLVSTKLLPVSLVPNVNIPQITIQVNGTDLSARELDEAVVKLLRQQLIQVSGLKDIRTETRDGSGTISMTFDYDNDINFIFIEINEKIDRTMGSLPEGIERPKVLKASATDIPAFYINLTVKDGKVSDEQIDNKDLFPVSQSFIDLSNFASQVIVRRIEQLSEVAMVDGSGYVYSELLIIPDKFKLHSAGISLSDLETAIKGANISLGNLVIRDGEYQFNIRFRTTLQTRKDIEEVFLSINGRLYQVKDLADVIEHPQKRSGMVRSDGKDAITLAVIKQSDAKMSDLKNNINRLMSNLRRSYPGIEFTVTRDQTALLDYSINNLIENIMIGALLACLVILLFMKNIRSSMLVVITIPSALLISFLFFHTAGLIINIISLSGLVLGVGMMVDNSIIVVDNITFRWRNGYPLREAVIKGTSEVFAPMLSSILTTCSVFVPLIFLSGMSGALFYDQAMAVVITLFSSLIVTITIIPVFYYLLYKNKKEPSPNKILSKISFDNMFTIYEKILLWLFRRRYIMWIVFAVSVVGIIILFRNMEKEKLPAITYNDVLLNVDWNERISAEENNSRTEKMLRTISEYTEQVTVMAGVQQFILPHTRENSVSETVVYLKAQNPGNISVIESAIGDYFVSNYPNAVFGFESSGNIFDMLFSDKEHKLVARLRSTDGKAPDPGKLNMLLKDISAKNPDIYIPPASYEEHILYVAKPEIMALYNISYNELIFALQNKLNENRLFTLLQGRFSVPVVLGDAKSGISELLENTFVSKNDIQIPLINLMQETRGTDLKTIVSGPEGDFYPLNISVEDREIPDIISSIKNIVRDNKDFEVDFSGSFYSNRELIKELVIILIIALALLYLILASQFESTVQPLIILSEIVVDIFGALTVMHLLGVSINMMSLIGIVVMCGIVINDSILKVDTINKLRKEGEYSLIRAIMEGGRRRLNAIIMTSLTTILSVTPFLVKGGMGSDLQYPLSIALISGMIVGTLVSIFFIPLAYYEIYRKRKKN